MLKPIGNDGVSHESKEKSFIADVIHFSNSITIDLINVLHLSYLDVGLKWKILNIIAKLAFHCRD